MDHQAIFKMAARALLAPAWMALAVGAAQLLLHVVIKRRTRFEAAMLLRQHSQFHEPMPPVLTLPKRDAIGPVAPAKRSASAQRKAASKVIDHAQPAHSFATLMAEMATLVRNTCRTPSAGPDTPTFDLLTTATAHQQRALALIRAIQA